MRKQDRWYNRIVRDSRRSDRLAKRLVKDVDRYVTTEDLIKMQQDQRNRCYYCQIFMDWIQRRRGGTGLTLERFNNCLPHYTSNCCLACKACNSKRVSREEGLLKKYFNIWYEKTFGVTRKWQGNRRCSFVI